MVKVVETLLYALKPGAGTEFDRIMPDISVPLHQRTSPPFQIGGLADRAMGAVQI